MPLRRRRRSPRITLETQPDGIPKSGLFVEPVTITALEALAPEVLEDGRHRATFRVEVRDAEGSRCPDLAVEACVGGPERRRTVQGTTDLFGRVRFRMAGPPGRYHIEVTDVAAKGLRWDDTTGPRTAEVELRA